MRAQIITQAADMRTIQRFLSGEYAAPRSTRITCWLVAAICAGTAISMVTELRDWPAMATDERATAVLIMFSLFATAAFMLVHAHTSFVFTDEFIERRSALRFLNRRVAAAHIHEGYLVLFDHRWSLEIVPAEGAKLTIPLEGRLRSDFARLYSEIGQEDFPSLSTPVLNERFRLVIYAVVALLIVAFVVIAVVLTRRGMLAW